ncbi:TPA: transcriptional regulator, partial [Escherichia coli]
TELFRYLSDMGKDINSVLNDDRDFRTLMRETDDPDILELLSTERAIKRLATGINKELDIAFNHLEII